MPRSRSPAFVAIRALISSRVGLHPLRESLLPHPSRGASDSRAPRLRRLRRRANRGSPGEHPAEPFARSSSRPRRRRLAGLDVLHPERVRGRADPPEELRVPFDAVEAQPQRPIEASDVDARDRSRKCGSPTFVRAHEHVTERVAGSSSRAARKRAASLLDLACDPKLRHGLQQNARGNLVGPLAPPPDANDRALHLEEPTPGRRSHAARSRSRGCSRCHSGTCSVLVIFNASGS